MVKPHISLLWITKVERGSFSLKISLFVYLQEICLTFDIRDRKRLRRLNMRDINSPQREREIQREPVIIAGITLKTQIYWFALKFLIKLLPLYCL